MLKNYSRKPNVTCLICDKPIYRRKGVITKNHGRVFCSPACHGVSRRKETPCVICRKPILSGANKKTCSRKCANKHRAGIKYTGKRLKDKVKSQRALKNRLLVLRGASCERCNYSLHNILQVHHTDRNRSRNNLENLELLCPNCHCEEHYTQKGLTKA